MTAEGPLDGQATCVIRRVFGESCIVRFCCIFNRGGTVLQWMKTDSMRENPSGRWMIWLSHGLAHTEYAFHGHGAQIMTLHDRRSCWWTRLWRIARKRSYPSMQAPSFARHSAQQKSRPPLRNFEKKNLLCTLRVNIDRRKSSAKQMTQY